MADGVPITAGSGTTVATDDTGAPGHVQLMKLAISTDGSATLIGADATNGLDVDVTRLIPGTSASHLGKAEDVGASDGDTGVAVWGIREYAGAGTDGDYSGINIGADGIMRVKIHRQTKRAATTSGGLTTAATAYTAGDQLGNQFTMANCARASGGSGIITGITLISAADTIGAIDVVITDSSITLAGNDAAYSISDADALKVIEYVQLSGPVDIGANRVASATGLAIPFVASGSADLFAGLITRFAIPATPFGAATDIQLNFYIEQD